MKKHRRTKSQRLADVRAMIEMRVFGLDSPYSMYECLCRLNEQNPYILTMGQLVSTYYYDLWTLHYAGDQDASAALYIEQEWQYVKICGLHDLYKSLEGRADTWAALMAIGDLHGDLMIYGMMGVIAESKAKARKAKAKAKAKAHSKPASTKQPATIAIPGNSQHVPTAKAM